MKKDMKALLRLLGLSFGLAILVSVVIALSVAGWIRKEIALGIAALLLYVCPLYVFPHLTRGLTQTDAPASPDEKTKETKPQNRPTSPEDDATR